MMTTTERPMRIICCPSKAVRDYANRHPERIAEIDYGSGYTTSSGNAYNILLAPGWCTYDDYACHTIIEGTAKDALYHLRNAGPCDCKECREIIAERSK